MHGLTSTIGVICTVCEQPALVCHRSCHMCVNVVFVPRALFTPTSTLRSGHIARTKLRTFGLHEIFKCAYLKFTVYGHKPTDIHTHASCNAVTLVWGLLRLAPINTSQMIYHHGGEPERAMHC